MNEEISIEMTDAAFDKWFEAHEVDIERQLQVGTMKSRDVAKAGWDARPSAPMLMRPAVASLIRARGGKLRSSGKTFACYSLPMNEEKFFEFREEIPFVTVWQTEEKGRQLFTVHFDKLR